MANCSSSLSLGDLAARSAGWLCDPAGVILTAGVAVMRLSVGSGITVVAGLRAGLAIAAEGSARRASDLSARLAGAPSSAVSVEGSVSSVGATANTGGTACTTGVLGANITPAVGLPEAGAELVVWTTSGGGASPLELSGLGVTGGVVCARSGVEQSTKAAAIALWAGRARREWFVIVTHQQFYCR